MNSSHLVAAISIIFRSGRPAAEVLRDMVNRSVAKRRAEKLILNNRFNRVNPMIEKGGIEL
jgi:hypothetical protein